MEKKPKIKIKLTKNDKVIEIIGWLTLGLLWVLAILNYSSLPDIIPTHLNVVGEVNNYGGKGTILFLPILGTILFVGMTIMNKFPPVFNLPVGLTCGNTDSFYTDVTRMIRYLKFAVVLLFSFIVQKTSHMATGKSDVLGTWFLPLIIVFIFVPVIFYLIRSFRKKQ